MDLTGQWADALLAAERVAVAKMMVWALASLAAGSLLLTIVRIRSLATPLLHHFGLQLVAWGAVEGAWALWSRRGLALRDLSAAVALDRSVWFHVGLETGMLAVGVTIAACGWRFGRKQAAVGAGLGVALHGAALALIDLQLAAQVIR
jgi:hypothetical protein